MKQYPINKLGQGESRDVFCAGATFVYVKEAPNDLIISIDDGLNKLSFAKGSSFKLPIEVDKKIVVENSGSMANFVIVAGVGEYQEPQIVGEVTVKPFKSSQGLDLINFDVKSKVIEANPDRRELHLTAASDNKGVIYHSADQAGKGIPIEAGQTVTLPLSGALGLYAAEINDKLHATEFE